jgi:4-amino-4-deoxy-L-arabinose transferase-like glycosyltransferase
VGLALRIFLVLRFPTVAGDSAIYENLARNWLDAHVYGLANAGRIIPTDIRGPGYPAFVALLYLFIRRGETVISLAQAFLDIGTCLLTARLAALLSPEPQRRRTALAALWLAATCPLIANYATVPLTEILATFLTAAALVALAGGCVNIGKASAWKSWFAGGLLVGIGTLVRPETPLVLIALALVLMVRWRRRADWSKLTRVGLLAGAGLLLPLTPWAARNWIRFHEVQFLAPRFAASPDEYVPRGVYAWTATWLVRYRDVYLVEWPLNTDPIPLADISPAAFDSPGEQARVAALLDQYNDSLCVTPEIDRGFAQLARERTMRHPLRTYLWVPIGRAATLWLTPRVELLPVSGHLENPREKWRTDRVDFIVTVLFFALNFFYLGIAATGFYRIRSARNSQPPGAGTALALLVVFVLVRTAFLTQVEAPEPRYVLECFPVLFALGAMCWLEKMPSATRAARGGS